MRRTPTRAAAVLLGTLLPALLLAACSSEQDPGPSEPSAQAPAQVSTSLSTQVPASGGTAAKPATPVAADDPLEWRPAPGAVADTVTTNGTWFLTVDASGRGYRLDGPDQSSGTGEKGSRITTALLDTGWAVVVRQSGARKEPSRAEVTDLRSGDRFDLDQSSDLPTVAGGTWALGGDTLVHATTGPGGAYCLASVDLATRKSAIAWCARPGHGFNAAHVTAAGTTVLGFDDARPSCRTVGSVAGGQLHPFPGVPECSAWEGALIGPDSAVWSVVPDEHNVEAAELFARVGDGYYDLGPGTSGTLVPCAGAAYFVRDPQVDKEPARLMRWDGNSLAVVYEAPPGQSFLEAPRCGDSAIVVTALSEGGDEQVMAALS